MQTSQSEIKSSSTSKEVTITFKATEEQNAELRKSAIDNRLTKTEFIKYRLFSEHADIIQGLTLHNEENEDLEKLVTTLRTENAVLQEQLNGVSQAGKQDVNKVNSNINVIDLTKDQDVVEELLTWLKGDEVKGYIEGQDLKLNEAQYSDINLLKGCLLYAKYRNTTSWISRMTFYDFMRCFLIGEIEGATLYE